MPKRQSLPLDKPDARSLRLADGPEEFSGPSGSSPPKLRRSTITLSSGTKNCSEQRKISYASVLLVACLAYAKALEKRRAYVPAIWRDVRAGATGLLARYHGTTQRQNTSLRVYALPELCRTRS
jgi:hypothetical protein